MNATGNLSGRRGFLLALTGAMAVTKLVAASDKGKSAKKMVRIVEFDAAYRDAAAARVPGSALPWK